MQVPSEKPGTNKQDLSGHSFVPTWPAQAVQQPFPDTWDSGSPPQPNPAPPRARRPEALGSAAAPGSGLQPRSVSLCILERSVLGSAGTRSHTHCPLPAR